MFGNFFVLVCEKFFWFKARELFGGDVVKPRRKSFLVAPQDVYWVVLGDFYPQSHKWHSFLWNFKFECSVLKGGGLGMKY